MVEPSTSPQGDASSLPQMSFEQMQAPSESSPVMVDPTMADDLNVLERHLASRVPQGGSDVRPYVRISNGPDESIVYRTVSRLRKGLQSTESPGVAQREIMENVLGPLTVYVIKLYAHLSISHCAPLTFVTQILRHHKSFVPHPGRGLFLEAVAEGS
jgi:hypothetical protein